MASASASRIRLAVLDQRPQLFAVDRVDLGAADKIDQQDGEVVMVAEPVGEVVDLVRGRLQHRPPGVPQQAQLVPEVLAAFAQFVDVLEVGCPRRAPANASRPSR